MNKKDLINTMDNGMIQALTPSYQDDYGKLFENLVFLWLRRKAPFLRGLFLPGKRC
jgi:predicted AAA+ superfamily ATPase